MGCNDNINPHMQSNDDSVTLGHAYTEGRGKSAMDTQVGGSHYADFKIQPFVFFHGNKTPFAQADIIKRILRYDKPTGKGLEDLRKIKHEVDMLIELEYGSNNAI